jgi:hypothetical protein
MLFGRERPQLSFFVKCLFCRRGCIDEIGFDLVGCIHTGARENSYLLCSYSLALPLTHPSHVAVSIKSQSRRFLFAMYMCSLCRLWLWRDTRGLGRLCLRLSRWGSRDHEVG